MDKAEFLKLLQNPDVRSEIGRIADEYKEEQIRLDNKKFIERLKRDHPRDG